MIEFLFRLIAYISLKLSIFFNWLARRTPKSRFDVYSPYVDPGNWEGHGILAAESAWQLATPNLKRPEDTLIAASNLVDRTSLVLRFKWRPDAQHQLTTLLSQLSLDLDGRRYQYEEVSTYQPKCSNVHPPFITQFGHSGSQLKLFVLNPHRKYRIVFRGFMKSTDEEGNQSSYFVRLNLMAIITSKVYDFKNDYRADLLVKQMAAKRQVFCPFRILEKTILHDRHEHTLNFIGECSLRNENEKEFQVTSRKVHLWGFHARDFVGPSGERAAARRLMGHLDNGQAFNLSSVQVPKSRSEYTCGYTVFTIGASVHSIEDFSLDWSQVTRDKEEWTGFEFKIKSQAWNHHLVAKKGDKKRDFVSLSMKGEERGWTYLCQDDSDDTKSERAAIQMSRSDYLLAIKSRDVVSQISPEGEALNTINSKPLLVNLDDPACEHATLVGAKAASLAMLRQKAKIASGVQFEVPPGIVLTRFAYDHLQETNPNLIIEVQQLSAQIGRGDLDGLPVDCERLQRVFESEARLSDQLTSSIDTHLRSHLNISNLETLDGRSFAVRSSSWGEDEDDMSAAGQLSTILDVRSIKHLRQAVLQCFASKFNPINIEYKRQRGMPLDLPMAVVIQEMVACDKAGVLFTCDPTSGDTSLLTITANFGLGESVVSGQTDPDTIQVRVKSGDSGRTRLEVEKILVGTKKVIMSAHGSEHQQDADRSQCCLSRDEELRLAECGLEMARYFGCPRDLEWGLKGEQLYLFQSRPVTGLDAYTEYELLHEIDAPTRAEQEYATRANIGEVTPFAATPIMSTFTTPVMGIFICHLLIQASRIKLVDYCLYYSGDFFSMARHTFFSCRGQSMFSFGSKSGESNSSADLAARSMEIGFFGHEVNDKQMIERAREVADPHPGRFSDLRFALTIWKQCFLTYSQLAEARRIVETLRKDVNSHRYAKHRNVKTPAEGLLRQVHVMTRKMKLPLWNHHAISVMSSKANMDLLITLSKYYQEPSDLHTAFSKILAATPEVFSAKIPRSIARMAALIGKMAPEQVKAFVQMTSIDGLQFVSRDPKSELAIEFNEFMVKFGHRCYNEFEPAQNSWKDEPEKVVEMLQTNVRRYLDGGDNKDAPTAKLDNMTVDQLIDSLKIKFTFMDRLWLKYIGIPNSQKYLSAREMTKDTMIYSFDVQRDAMRLLARELRQINRIPDDDLFYYFVVQELRALVREPQPALVLHAARRRRVTNQFKETWKFDEIITGYEFLPLHMQPSRSIDSELANAPKLHGTTACGGRVQAKVCLINGYHEINKIRAGQILLAYSTDIAFSPVFPLVSGVITEVGGLISHGAVVAREYGLPCIIGVPGITEILEDGEEIILDADKSTIIRLKMIAPSS